MKILIAFGSSEGQTRKIAKYIAEKIGGEGHEPDIYDCGRRPHGREVASYDAIIIAASVHQEDHQESAVAFAVAHREQLEAKPSAFISVSLSAAFENGAKDAQRYIERFTEATGWQPAVCLMTGGALKLSEYDFFKEQIIRYVVMAGRDVPADRKDWEFTDWAALDAFLAKFLADAQERLQQA